MPTILLVGTTAFRPAASLTPAEKWARPFVFNGSTSHIPVPALPRSLDIGATGSGVTIEGWIKPNQLGLVGAAGLPIVEWDSARNDALLLWVEANYQLFADIKDTGNNPHVIQSAPNSINTNSLQKKKMTYTKRRLHFVAPHPLSMPTLSTTSYFHAIDHTADKDDINIDKGTG